MQITNALLQRLSLSAPGPFVPPASHTCAEAAKARPIGRLDFSNVTARQVGEYVDDLLARGAIDPDDAAALAHCMPSAWYDTNLDTTFNLRAEMESIRDYDKAHRLDVKAAFYEGLLQRMKLMEDRSVHVSIVA